MTPTRPHTGPRHTAGAELVNREDEMSADFESRVQRAYQDALRLDVQRGYLIECWRCNTESFVEDHADDPQEAQQEFHIARWRKDKDGYQMCPACWGDRP